MKEALKNVLKDHERLFVRPKTAAKMLDISERSLRHLAQTGVIRKRYIGSMPRYAVEDLRMLGERRPPFESE